MKKARTAQRKAETAAAAAAAAAAAEEGVQIAPNRKRKVFSVPAPVFTCSAAAAAVWEQAVAVDQQMATHPAAAAGMNLTATSMAAAAAAAVWEQAVAVDQQMATHPAAAAGMNLTATSMAAAAAAAGVCVTRSRSRKPRPEALSAATTADAAAVTLNQQQVLAGYSAADASVAAAPAAHFNSTTFAAAASPCLSPFAAAAAAPFLSSALGAVDTSQLGQAAEDDDSLYDWLGYLTTSPLPATATASASYERDPPANAAASAAAAAAAVAQAAVAAPGAGLTSTSSAAAAAPSLSPFATAAAVPFQAAAPAAAGQDIHQEKDWISTYLEPQQPSSAAATAAAATSTGTGSMPTEWQPEARVWEMEHFLAAHGDYTGQPGTLRDQDLPFQTVASSSPSINRSAGDLQGWQQLLPGGYKQQQGAHQQLPQGGYHQLLQGAHQQLPQGGYQQLLQGAHQQPPQGGYQQLLQGAHQQPPQGGYHQLPPAAAAGGPPPAAATQLQGRGLTPVAHLASRFRPDQQARFATIMEQQPGLMHQALAGANRRALTAATWDLGGVGPMGLANNSTAAAPRSLANPVTHDDMIQHLCGQVTSLQQQVAEMRQQQQ